MDARSIFLALAICTSITACSSGLSEGDAEDAVLSFIKENGHEDSAIEKFDLGKCEATDETSPYGQVGFLCDVKVQVKADQGRFNEDLSYPYFFAKVDGKWKVNGDPSQM